MATQQHRSRGFTLVEVLFVVAILGVLASVVVTQFTGVVNDSRATATKAMLKVLRVQLQIYRVHHENRYPTLAELWPNLTGKSGVDGALDPDGAFGPYLTQEPRNQYTGSTTVVAIGEASSGDGWEYDEATGHIQAVGFNEDTHEYVPVEPAP